MAYTFFSHYLYFNVFYINTVVIVLKESELEVRQYLCDRCGCNWQGKDGIHFRNNIVTSINPIQWCKKCLTSMNLEKGHNLTMLKNKIGCYDQDKSNCVECGEDNCASSYHALKTLKFCMTCVIKKKCLCRACKMAAVDIGPINLLRIFWKNYLEQFEKKKELFPTMRVQMMHYLNRPPTDLENQTYVLYTTLELKHSSRQAFNVYGVVCTYADVQELLCGTGTKFPYLKATIVRMFYELINDKLEKDKLCHFMQNAMDINESLKGMFDVASEGIFVYDYFVYSGVHNDQWCSVIVEKKEHLKYDIITFLPSASLKETNDVVSTFVMGAMNVQYELLKDKNNAESPWVWEKLDLNRIEVVEDTAANKFGEVHTGIYTIFKTYLYLFQKDDMMFSSKDIERMRHLVLYMIINMDINYGQVKMTNESTTPSTTLKL